MKCKNITLFNFWALFLKVLLFEGSSIVNEVIKTILSQLTFFTKKSKPTNKTKLSEQETTKATIFRAQKLLRGRKLVILRFIKKLKLS